jgi:hypothetical protein
MLFMWIPVAIAILLAGCSRPSFKGQDTPRGTLRKLHGGVARGDVQSVAECLGGYGGGRRELAAVFIEWVQVAQSLKAEFIERYGRAKAETLLHSPKLHITVYPEDPNWVDAVDIQKEGDVARYYDPYWDKEVMFVRKGKYWVSSIVDEEVRGLERTYTVLIEVAREWMSHARSQGETHSAEDAEEWLRRRAVRDLFGITVDKRD